MRTKDVFDNVKNLLLDMRSVDNVYWNAEAPSTSRPQVVGNYVSIVPNNEVYGADNVTQYNQWQFLMYYVSEDFNAHLDFVDELEQFVPVSVVSLYNKHRIVGWKPYSIIKLITNGNLNNPTMDNNNLGVMPL